MNYIAELAKRKRQMARRMLYESGVMSIDIPRPVERSPGECPKCGRHIGKGIAIHVKHCNGDQ